MGIILNFLLFASKHSLELFCAFIHYFCCLFLFSRLWGLFILKLGFNRNKVVLREISTVHLLLGEFLTVEAVHDVFVVNFAVICHQDVRIVNSLIQILELHNTPLERTLGQLFLPQHRLRLEHTPFEHMCSLYYGVTEPLFVVEMLLDAPVLCFDSL